MEWSLKLHSVVDVITNSSTVIYTSCNQEVIKNLKEAINKLLDVFNVYEWRADDLFEFKLVEFEPLYKPARLWYMERVFDWDKYYCEQMYKQIVLEPEKPDWWNDVEELNLYTPTYDLIITAKAKYANLASVADSLMKMLNAVEAEEYDR